MRGLLKLHDSRQDKFVPHAIQQRMVGHADSSPLFVSEAAFGIMTMGEQADEGESEAMLSFASDMGVNLFDTSEVYPIAPRPETCGESSRILGRWLTKTGIKRESVYLASKVCGRSPILDWIPSARITPMEAKAGPYSSQLPRVDRKSIRDAAEGELLRLKTDYLDLFQIHWPDRPVPLFGRVQFRPDQHLTDPNTFTSFEEQVIGVPFVRY